MKQVRGLKKTWHKNGNIKEMFYTINDKKDGEYKMFSEDGPVLISCTYKNGKISGTLESFTNDGNKNLEFKNGLRHGDQFEYVNGKLAKKYKCYKDTLNGEYLIYDLESESLSVQCHLVDGILNGQFARYVDEKLKSIYNYKDGRFNGECREYNNGKCMIGYFRNGLPINKWKEIDENGKMIKTYVSSKFLANSIFRAQQQDISM